MVSEEAVRSLLRVDLDWAFCKPAGALRLTMPLGALRLAEAQD